MISNIAIPSLSIPQHLGDSVNILNDLAQGKHPFCKKLAAAKKPMIVVGSGALQRDDGVAIHSLVSTVAQKARVNSKAGEEWKVLNVLHRVRPMLENAKFP